MVAALIEDAQGRILIAQRPPGRHHAGLWEFPGGKIEPGETAFAALTRELGEELAINIVSACRVMTVIEQRDHNVLRMQAWRVLEYSGQAQAIEASALAWCQPIDLPLSELPPADLPIARCLQMPARYVISPDLHALDPIAVLDWLQQALDRGAVWVRLRCSDPGYRLSPTLVENCAHRAAQRAAMIFVDLADHLANPDFSCGVHLRSADLNRDWRQRPAPTGPLLASCHDAQELALAEQLQVDAAVISPILPTASHPGQAGLGWSGFRRLLESTTLPAFALGGLASRDLTQARAAGAIGIAGIRSILA